MTQENQYRKLLAMAYHGAQNSPDPSTQNFAIICDDQYFVLAGDTNTFPRGIAVTPERLERPQKYDRIEHAERSSIYKAARLGISTNNETMVCCWAACTDCARAIIQAGIKRLVRHQDATDRSPDSWLKSILIADDMLNEAGVEIVNIFGSVHSGVQVRHSGNIWTP